MTKTEFLEELRDSLQGEVPAGVIQENQVYYDNYITQELTRGRSEDDIIGELGGPRIIARTIIDSSEAAEAAGEGQGNGGYYTNTSTAGGGASTGVPPASGKAGSGRWFSKMLIIVIVLFILFFVFSLVGGIFSLMFRYAGPLIIIWLVYSLFKGMRR